MNQSGDPADFTAQGEDSLAFNEIFDDAEYSQVEIKSFRLDVLFNEIEQLLLSPLQPEQVSLPA